MDELKIAVEEPGSWARRLTITVPAERVSREKHQVARHLAKRLKLPGFRKGRIPSQILEQRYGSSIEQEAVERLVGSAFREALERKGLEPISQGQVGQIDYSPGADLTFQVQFDVRPKIEVGRVGGFKVERRPSEVADEEVARVLERLREEQAVWSTLEAGPGVDGDMAVAEITPVAPDAEPEQSPDARRYQIVFGQEQVLPEIEETLREMQPGEERERTVQLEAEAQPDGAPVSREQRVRIRLLELRRPELPALDDEFAASVGEFSDLAELRGRVREDLEREALSESERDVHRQLIDRLIEANPFDVPDSMVQRYLEGMLPAKEGADPQRVAEIRQSARPAAERALKRMLLVEHLAEREGLRAGDDEVEERIREIAERNHRPVAEVRAQLRKSGRLDALADEITERRVFEFLESKSEIA